MQSPWWSVVTVAVLAVAVGAVPDSRNGQNLNRHDEQLSQNLTAGGSARRIESFPEEELLTRTLKEKLKPSSEWIQKNYPFQLTGHDFEGRPIWLAELGRYDLRGLVEQGEAKMDDFRLHCKWFIRFVLESIQNATSEDWPVNSATMILDFDRLPMLQLLHPPTAVFGLDLLRQNHHLIDMFVHKLFIINANAVTGIAFNLAKPILRGTMERFEIFGSNRNKWLSRFRNEFPKNQLPERYGGSRGHKNIRVFG